MTEHLSSNQFKSYTSDKTAELCLYYNIALDRMNDLISTYENKKIYIEEINWQTFGGFKTTTYLHLKTYLWKERISENFANLRLEDREIIHGLLNKLVQLRHFQSHYYHDASVLKFDEKLWHFVLSKYANVRAKLSEEFEQFGKYFTILDHDIAEFETANAGKKTDVYKHFIYFNNRSEIQPEGKNFFLSFFLLKGEMNHFLKKRKRCKRDNGEKYQVKTKLLTWQCHRDASNRFFLAGKKEYSDTNEQLRRQFNTVLNYLKTVPVAHLKFIPPTEDPILYSRYQIQKRKKGMAQDTPEQKEVIRRRSRFLELAIRYFMDRKNLGHNDEVSIYWHITDPDYKEVQSKNTEEPDHSYHKKPKRFINTYKANFFPIFTNRHIKFKINGQEPEFAIGEREMKNWLFYLLDRRKSLSETAKAIQQYGGQYLEARKELVATGSITFEKYPVVFDRRRDSVVLSGMYRKILNDESFDLVQYREKIDTYLDRRIKRLTYHLESGNYNRHQKNRIILECLNWYLPQDGKLSRLEVEQISKYNYLSSHQSISPAARESIIRNLVPKLSKAKEHCDKLVLEAIGLDELFIDIVIKKKISLEHEKAKLEDRSLDELHRLAGKLGVSLPGIDVSRNGLNRLDELKNTIRNKPVLISNGLFKRYFNPEKNENISNRVLKNLKWMGLLIPNHYKLSAQQKFIDAASESIPPGILSRVEEREMKAYGGLSAPVDGTFRALVDVLCNPGEIDNDATRKQIAQALNLNKRLREIRVKDALLAQILYQYHNHHLPLSDREVGHTSIAKLFDKVCEIRLKVKGGQTVIKMKYSELDNLSTYYDRAKLEKLISHPEYWSDSQHQEMEKKGKITDQQKIQYLRNLLYKESFQYIRAFLQIEGHLLGRHKNQLDQMLTESRKEKSHGLARIEPNVLLKRLPDLSESDREALVSLRGNAFHVDIPDAQQPYQKSTAYLEGLIESKKRPKKSDPHRG